MNQPTEAQPTQAQPQRPAASLSPSRAADFLQCPQLYKFRAIDKLPEPPTLATAKGTLVHLVLERLMAAPRAERTPPHAISLLPQAWSDLRAEQPGIAELIVDDATDAELLEDAQALLHKYFELEDPTRFDPAGTELRVEAVIDGGLTLRGFVDRVDVAPTGQVRVVDYKTGRAPSALFEAKALFQMKFYALLWWHIHGVVPSLLQLVYLRDGVILRYEPDERDVQAVERKVRAIWSAIERAATHGDWRPTPSKLCGWCHFQSICPAWPDMAEQQPISTASDVA